MSDYKVREIIHRDIDLDDDEVMTLKDAAEELNVSLHTVIGSVNAGRSTEVIDESRSTKYRRLVLKKEIEEWKKDHPV